MYSRLLPGSEKTAVWIANKNIVPQLYTMSLAVGTGGAPVYMPANAAAGAPFQTLLGLPIIFSEHASTLGTQGDLILGDFANGYILAEKGGVQIDMSIHCRYTYDESTFRFVYRVDGQPVLASAVTPYKGTSCSHFVVIDTRA